MQPGAASLAVLYAELAAMRSRPCGLAHERVVVDAAGVRRRAPATDGDPGLVRGGLCPRELRARQLSCAHTRSRFTLDKAIAAAACAGVLAPHDADRLHTELRRIEHAIHMLDWDKSAAEVKLALSLDAGSTEAAGAHRHACAAMSARHARLSEELGRLQATVLAMLENAMAAASAPQLEEILGFRHAPGEQGLLHSAVPITILETPKCDN